MRKLFSLLLALCIGQFVQAQELNCQVKVLHAAIQNVDKQVFRNMEQFIGDFMNTRKWTTDEFRSNEKIEVNIMINLTGKSPDDDIYSGTLNIQASRPVFNSGYMSPTVNYVDKDLSFKYSQFTSLQFDDNRVSGNDPMAANLPAVLAYYAYIIIGLDYDSFAPEGGSVYLKRAQNIVNNAPEQSKSIGGWKAVEGTKNRYWLIDQMLSPRFQDVRNYWYTLHREGMDKMYNQPEEARQNILAGVAKLHAVNAANPSSILIQFFFNAKSDEMIKIVAQLPKEQRAPYVSQLSQMDVANSVKYQALK